MKGDHRSYARATSTSLLGLAAQVTLGLGLLIYAVVGRDNAAFSASLHVLVMSLVWVVLVVVFDQHRRERLEALEAESLDASAAREASVFGTSSDDLRVNAKRLAWMHRVLVPGASVLLALLLIGLGVWRYLDATRATTAKTGTDVATGTEVIPSQLDSFVGLPLRGWAIALGLGLAVVGFVFARYCSGMARQGVWGLLRSGAGAVVCVSLFGLAIALGQFAEILGADKISRWLLVGFPIASVVLGVEVLLNFMLNLYRPRKAGELPRPAMESWLLASVAAPDQIARSVGGAIQYQFGVDVSGSWAYARLRAWLPRLVVLGIAALWLMTAVTVVGPDERGVRVRLGERLGEVPPGLALEWPWPVGRIEKVQVTELQSIALATPRPPEKVKHVLWTNDHQVKDETKLLVRTAKSIGGTDDARSLIVVEVPMTFRVKQVAGAGGGDGFELGKYEGLAVPAARDNYIRAVAKREVLRFLTTLDEDQIMGARRTEAGAELKKRISVALDGINSGVEVVFVAIEGVHPPRGPEGSTALSYESIVSEQVRATAVKQYAELEATAQLIKAAGSVEAARAIVAEIDRLAELTAAKASEGEVNAQQARLDALITAAGGEAAQILARAQADRWTRVMAARGRAEAYAGRLEAFNANPGLYMYTAYLDTLTDVFRNTRLYIVQDQVEDLRMQMDLKDLGSTVDVFSSENK